MNLNEHPCFNASAHHRFGRVHLPVAPRCNMQCKYCNRRFDCVSESRPGVTSAVLSPAQAESFLEEVLRQRGDIRVVGIAGPGDPFANPAETLDTFARVRRRHPQMMLCVASNGLNLAPHLDALARLQVSHVTLTVNAVDPAIGARIYSWMRIGKRVADAAEGAAILLQRQLDAIAGLKARGILVKVNSIVLPGINDDHIATVAERMGGLGVDLFNAMPYYPNPGSAFEDLGEPPADRMAAIRAEAAHFVAQMRHCTRCRADAVGLLGEPPSAAWMATLQHCQHLSPEADAPAVRIPRRPYVAVASQEGMLVNQHLGVASTLLVYGTRNARVELIETRQAPEPGGGETRWQRLARTLCDCRTLLVSGIGSAPRQVLTASGLEIIECEAVIDEAVQAVLSGQSLQHLAAPRPAACGQGCGGGRMGCV
jgi:nitrogen fixation protein NifB